MLTSSSIGIVSAFGPPRERRTWSSAPANVADGLEHYGLRVVGIDTSMGRIPQVLFAGAHLMSGYGLFRTSEAIARGPMSRQYRAKSLQRKLLKEGLSSVIHTGTLDMAPLEDDPVAHFLYCDHTWHPSLTHRPDLKSYSPLAIREFDEFEHACYANCKHIFTFGEYVAEDLIDYYCIPRERVTVVGSGHGDIAPYTGPKDFGAGRLLFIAKHLFVEKGGRLLLDAFRIAQRERPDLTLTIVGTDSARSWAEGAVNVTFLPFVPWEQLQMLLRESTLLVQPMLNDPWGQVYLEALTSRTPVIGLNRNGLTEITNSGAYGFLVDDADPYVLAYTIIEAASDPVRLAAMAEAGQRHVAENFSWERVARTIAGIVAGEDRSTLAA